jgi:hypothetical protein
VRDWHSGCAPAFQAGKTGSTPVSRFFWEFFMNNSAPWFGFATGSAVGNLLSPLIIPDFPWYRGAFQAVVAFGIIMLISLFFIKWKKT